MQTKISALVNLIFYWKRQETINIKKEVNNVLCSKLISTLARGKNRAARRVFLFVCFFDAGIGRSRPLY